MSLPPAAAAADAEADAAVAMTTAHWPTALVTPSGGGGIDERGETKKNAEEDPEWR